MSEITVANAGTKKFLHDLGLDYGPCTRDFQKNETGCFNFADLYPGQQRRLTEVINRIYDIYDTVEVSAKADSFSLYAADSHLLKCSYKKNITELSFQCYGYLDGKMVYHYRDFYNGDFKEAWPIGRQWCGIYKNDHSLTTTSNFLNQSSFESVYQAKQVALIASAVIAAAFFGVSLFQTIKKVSILIYESYFQNIVKLTRIPNPDPRNPRHYKEQPEPDNSHLFALAAFVSGIFLLNSCIRLYNNTPVEPYKSCATYLAL